MILNGAARCLRISKWGDKHRCMRSGSRRSIVPMVHVLTLLQSASLETKEATLIPSVLDPVKTCSNTEFVTDKVDVLKVLDKDYAIGEGHFRRCNLFWRRHVQN